MKLPYNPLVSENFAHKMDYTCKYFQSILYNWGAINSFWAISLEQNLDPEKRVRIIVV